MIFNTRERIEALTPLWTGDRLEDGRPMVPDDIIERMKLVTNDEAWGILEKRNGYFFQFEGNWMNLQPRRRPHRASGDGGDGSPSSRPARGGRTDRPRGRTQRQPEHLGDRFAGTKRRAGRRSLRQSSRRHLHRRQPLDRRPRAAPAPASSSTAASATTTASSS